MGLDLGDVLGIGVSVTVMFMFGDSLAGSSGVGDGVGGALSVVDAST